MPPAREQPRKGFRRIDAAIDHFAAMGYDPRDIRAVVADLLKVYEGPNAWPLLEEGSYQVVQDKLFEIEEEEKQKEDAQLLLEYHQHQDGQQVEDEPPQVGQQVEDEPPQPQEPVADQEVEDPMLIEPQDIISISNELLEETKSEDEEEEQSTGQKHEGV